jgi:hypothetical protein
MSPDTNAYVAIPMEGMRMSSSAAPARRRSSSNSKAWIVGGLIAVVLLLLVIFLLVSRVGHGFHDTSMEQQMDPLDTIVVVVEEPVVEDRPKIEMYKGKPIVLKEEGGEIVETYDKYNDDQVVDDDYEYEEDQVSGDYEDEVDEIIIKYDEEEQDEGAGYFEAPDDQEDDGVILVEYDDEELDEEFIVDDAMYDSALYEESPDEVIDEWSAELFDDEASEELLEIESFDEPDESLEEVAKEDVVTFERMGGN